MSVWKDEVVMEEDLSLGGGHTVQCEDHVA